MSAKIEVNAMDNGKVHLTIRADIHVVQFDMDADEAEDFGRGVITKAQKAREIAND